jgi:hypothetical protein
MYGEEVESWKEPKFMSLTIPNIKEDQLSALIDRILTSLRTIYRAINQRRKRKDLPIIKSIKKLETTFNRDRWDYHPHVHLLLEDDSEVDFIKAQWLKLWTEASPKWQHVRDADARSLAETVKYAVKSGGYVDKKFRALPIEALHAMYASLHGRKIVSPTGFTPKRYIHKAERKIYPGHDATYTWDQATNDWLDYVTGEVYSGLVLEPSDGRTRARDIVAS